MFVLKQNASKTSDKEHFELYQVFMHNILCQND